MLISILEKLILDVISSVFIEKFWNNILYREPSTHTQKQTSKLIADFFFHHVILEFNTS